MNDLIERRTFVHQHITNHVTTITGHATPGLRWEPWTPTNWATLCLGPLDQVTGWTSPTVDTRIEPDPDPALVVRYCPDIIARTTIRLPLSPKPNGPRPYIDPTVADDDNAPLRRVWFVDNYVRFVEHVLDCEVMEWAPGGDPHERRCKAEAALYDANPGGLSLLSQISLAALDAYPPIGGNHDQPQ